MTVHPRLRGELIIAHNTRTSAIGSSPLTRGTPRSRMTTIICLRFIPAYAGNSESHPAFVSSTAVHPRLRGELMNFDFVHHYFSGSSPLTRGTLSGVSAITINDRFIPAYAGNSWTMCLWTHFFSVHPRLRGELVEQEGVSNSSAGSSPLTRGTRRW